MQRSDSPARNVPGYWLGDPSAGFRWWFDATFTTWKVWACLVLPVGLVLVFAVPTLVLLVLGAWLLAGRAAPHVRQVRSRGGRNLTRHGIAALVVLGALLVATTPAWLAPLPWYVAILVTPLVAALVTKPARPFFDDRNTPPSYWISLLPRIAAGPRAARATSTFASAPVSATEPSPALTDIEYLALTLDPRKVIVKTAKLKTPTIEFDQWLPVDQRLAAETLAWLARCQAGVKMVDGNVLLVSRYRESSHVTRVSPGDMIVRQVDGRFEALRDYAFKAEFDVVSA